jgi:hypothetical protein
MSRPDRTTCPEKTSLLAALYNVDFPTTKATAEALLSFLNEVKTLFTSHGYPLQLPQDLPSELDSGLVATIVEGCRAAWCVQIETVLEHSKDLAFEAGKGKKLRDAAKQCMKGRRNEHEARDIRVMADWLNLLLEDQQVQFFAHGVSKRPHVTVGMSNLIDYGRSKSAERESIESKVHLALAFDFVNRVNGRKWNQYGVCYCCEPTSVFYRASGSLYCGLSRCEKSLERWEPIGTAGTKVGK